MNQAVHTHRTLPSNTDELKEQLRGIVAEVSEIDAIPDDVPFKELGIDSMMAVEIVAAVERDFRLSVHENELAQLTTLSQVFALVQRKLAVAA